MLKRKYMIMMVVVFLLVYIQSGNDVLNRLQLSLYNTINVVKITETKDKINDKNVKINIIIPNIHYQNEKIERYINTYIRKEINSYVNAQRQASISNQNDEKNIKINYNVVFENRDIINIVINKEIQYSKKGTILEKDSYIFDLNSGQRIYIEDLFSKNSNYKEIIRDYIIKCVDKNNIDLNKEDIIISQDTEYYLTDIGIKIYFNPYRINNDKKYEFKIPYDLVESKIGKIQKQEVEANVDVQTIVDNNKYISSVINIPIITLGDEDIEKKINDIITNDIMNYYEKIKKQAKDYYDAPEDISNKFIINSDFDIKKNSGDILSIVIKYYVYSGGAHGYSENVAYNIDTSKGDILEMDDLFKSNVDYKKIIDANIRHQIKDLINENAGYKDAYQFNGISDNQKYYIRNDDLVVYFDLYEIGPYVAGIVEFNINYDEISHAIKDEYSKIFE